MVSLILKDLAPMAPKLAPMAPKVAPINRKGKPVLIIGFVSMRTVKRTMSGLQKSVKIQREGSNRNGSWKVNYNLQAESKV